MIVKRGLLISAQCAYMPASTLNRYGHVEVLTPVKRLSRGAKKSKGPHAYLPMNAKFHPSSLVIFIATTLSLSPGLAFGADYSTTVLADGPIAYYRFSD